MSLGAKWFNWRSAGRVFNGMTQDESHSNKENCIGNECQPENEDAIPRERAAVEEEGQNVGHEQERHPEVQDTQPNTAGSRSGRARMAVPIATF